MGLFNYTTRQVIVASSRLRIVATNVLLMGGIRASLSLES